MSFFINVIGHFRRSLSRWENKIILELVVASNGDLTEPIIENVEAGLLNFNVDDVLGLLMSLSEVKFVKLLEW